MRSAISKSLNRYIFFPSIVPCLEADGSRYPNYYDHNHKLLPAPVSTAGQSPHLPFVIEGIMEVMGAAGEKLIVTSCAWSCVWFCFQISEKLRRIFFCSKLFGAAVFFGPNGWKYFIFFVFSPLNLGIPADFILINFNSISESVKMLIYFRTNESQFIFRNVVRGRVMALEGICCANSETKPLSKLCKSLLLDISESAPS